MKTLLAVLLVLTMGMFVQAPSQNAMQAQDVYVSPDGSPTNQGTLASPMDLASALSGDRIHPGATVWLRGGTYLGFFTSHLTGTAQAPITVRGYAHERAIIADNRAAASGSTVHILGAYTIYRDFEVTNLSTSRGHMHMFRPMGLEVQAPNTKFINLIIHDTGHGFGFWKESVDSELYGNIIFFGGSENEADDLRHGHGIYTQNNTGTKHITDNVIFDQYGWGIHGYPNPGELRGFDIEGNMLFDNGVSSSPEMRLPNIMVSGYKPHSAGQVRIAENYTYDSPRQKTLGKFSDTNLCLGCSDVSQHDDAEIRDNYFAGGGQLVAAIINWRQITFSDNTVYGPAAMVGLATPQGTSTSQYHWEGNHYFGTGSSGVLFDLNGKPLNFSQWREATGFDRTGSYTPAAPTGVKVVIRPNSYEKGRANVAIYNWDRKVSVPVDVSQVLQPGDAYELRNVQDLFGPPVLAGQYGGGPLQVPMTGRSVGVPTGGGAPPSTLPEFGVFLLTAPMGQRLSGKTADVSTGPRQEIAPDKVAGLGRYVGTFVSNRPNARVVVTLEGDHLVAKMMHEPEQPSFSLEPLGGERFHFSGVPSTFYLQFETTGGVPSAMTIYRPPLPSVRLMRTQ